MCLVVLRLKQILKIEYFFCKTATMRLFNTFWAKDRSYISQKSFVKQALGLLSFCLTKLKKKGLYIIFLICNFWKILHFFFIIIIQSLHMNTELSSMNSIFIFFIKCTINKHKFHVLARNHRYTSLSTI